MTVKDQNGIAILDHDEHMRPGTDMQSLGGLKPSFKDMGEGMPGFDAISILRYPELEKVNHVHHAGNSSGICDGAAAVLVGTKEAGERLGLKPRAKVRATAKIGSEPSIMLTGPLPATQKVLKTAGMEIGDIDLHEVNEAFAAVVMMYMAEFGVDHSNVNVNGGAIAMGHPLGATGRNDPGDRAGRVGALRQGDRADHALHRVRHGCRYDHRTRLSPGAGERGVRYAETDGGARPSHRSRIGGADP